MTCTYVDDSFFKKATSAVWLIVRRLAPQTRLALVVRARPVLVVRARPVLLVHARAALVARARPVDLLHALAAPVPALPVARTMCRGHDEQNLHCLVAAL